MLSLTPPMLLSTEAVSRGRLSGLCVCIPPPPFPACRPPMSSLREGLLQLEVCLQVVPAESKYAVLKTKVEVKLKKANSLFWKGLEKADRSGPTPAVVEQPKPTYPSSKKNTVDW